MLLRLPRIGFFISFAAAASISACSTEIAQTNINRAIASHSKKHQLINQTTGCNSCGTVEISDPTIYTRVAAISDVHGMYENLVSLLIGNSFIDANLNWTAGKTLLIVVGDSIDKGPQSIEVIDLWRSLVPQATTSGGKLIVLLGNHEAEFLANPSSPKAAALIAELHQKNIPVEELSSSSYLRGSFLRNLPVAAKVGKWLFVHGGYYPDMPWSDFNAKSNSLLSTGNYGDEFLIGDNSVLEEKTWWSREDLKSQVLSRLETSDMWGIVFGHQPGALWVVGDLAATNSGRIIKIDAAMNPDVGSHPGRILIFSNPSELLSANNAPQEFSFFLAS